MAADRCPERKAPEEYVITTDEATLLGIARAPVATPGSRERAARERLGLSPTQYAQALNDLIDTERALAFAPLLVNRLRRQRDAAIARKGHTS